MKQAEIFRQLLKEVEKLLNRNISENGECQLSLIKERDALELVLTDGKSDPQWHYNKRRGVIPALCHLEKRREKNQSKIPESKISVQPHWANYLGYNKSARRLYPQEAKWAGTGNHDSWRQKASGSSLRSHWYLPWPFLLGAKVIALLGFNEAWSNADSSTVPCLQIRSKSVYAASTGLELFILDWLLQQRVWRSVQPRQTEELRMLSFGRRPPVAALQSRCVSR